jgi:hypothetical protein
MLPDSERTSLGRRLITELSDVVGPWKPELRYFATAVFVEGKVSIINYIIASTHDKMYVLEAEYLLKIVRLKWFGMSRPNMQKALTCIGQEALNDVVKYQAHLEGTFSLEIRDENTNVGGVK